MRILLFHGVVPDSYTDLPRKHITESRFREVLDTLDDVFACKDIDIDNLPTGTAITFDDGYWNNYEIAWPILKEYGFPWTIFLTTGFIGTDRVIWTDKLRALLADPPDDVYDIISRWHKGYSELPDFDSDPMLSKFMSWPQVEIMNADPMVDFGAHTVNHVSCGQVPDDVCETEIWDSLVKLHKEGLLTDPPLFAFPEGQPLDINGHAENTLEDFARIQRIEFAFAATKDWTSPNRYRLPREMIC